MATARDRRRDEEAADDRAAEESRDDRQQRRKRKGRQRHEAPGPAPSVTERLKAKSHQSGTEAMNATPGGYPQDPANAEAVYTTGPGEAVMYNYVRRGTYSEEYARQMSEQSAAVPPIAGSGQVVTSGAANNPT